MASHSSTWDQAISRGLSLAETPYFLPLGYKRDPLSTEPMHEPSQLVGFESTLAHLLTLLAREGTERLSVISLIALKGGGATSLMLSTSRVLTEKKKSTERHVAEFAGRIRILFASAKGFSLDREEDQEDDHFSIWVRKVQEESPTHIFIDDCDVLGRYSVLPYVGALIERIDRPVTLVLRHTPSSYNRFLADVIRTPSAPEWLRGELFVKVTTHNEFESMLRKRLKKLDSLLDKDAITRVHHRAYGSIKQGFQIARLALEEAIANDVLPVGAILANEVSDRLGAIDLESPGCRLTSEQMGAMHKLVELGDHVTAEELAEELDVVRTATVRMLLRIEHKGWLLKYRLGARIVYQLTSNARSYIESRVISDHLRGPSKGTS